MRIVKSKRSENAVVVDWTTGTRLFFNASCIRDDPVIIGEATPTMVIVSRTSAECALNGCEVS